MALFDKNELKVLSDDTDLDMSNALMTTELSAVDYDLEGKFFYITIDKILFLNPLKTIKSVLSAQGYVENLENILYCLDSLIFSIHAQVSKKTNDSQTTKVTEYLPCVRFELPQKNKVGDTLQSFYDEISKYESKLISAKKTTQVLETEIKKDKVPQKEVDALKNKNAALEAQISALSEALIEEKKRYSSAFSDKDTHDTLPGNTKICRVEHIDLKKRLVKMKSLKKIIDIPTHMLDRVPNHKARCLITFDDDNDIPLGVLFFDKEELGNAEKRTADLLYVEGDTFKARDSKRNEFQIQAVNDTETMAINRLRRGMKLLISTVDGYVVRFSVLGEKNEHHFSERIEEQMVVFDIGRNQLVNIDTTENQNDVEGDE